MRRSATAQPLPSTLLASPARGRTSTVTTLSLKRSKAASWARPSSAEPAVGNKAPARARGSQRSRMERPSGRGGRLRAPRRGGGLLGRRGGTVLEGDLLAGEADADGTAVLQPPEKDLVGQGVAELGLDEPAQGPGPEHGVEALAGEMGPGLGSELDRHPPLPELRLELQHELVHDRLHDLEVEGLE